MKYVTLEHRQSLPYGVIGCTYTRFDTNDNSFENEAREKRHQRHLNRQKAQNQLVKEIEHLTKQVQQNKEELDQLRSDTPILKRLFSKEYKTKINLLQKQQLEQISQRLKLRREAERIDDNFISPFDEYYDLKTLLKEQGYVLVNKTTDDRYTTTEIWHKD